MTLHADTLSRTFPSPLSPNENKIHSQPFCAHPYPRGEGGRERTPTLY